MHCGVCANGRLPVERDDPIANLQDVHDKPTFSVSVVEVR
jgi:hypothetical protein